MKQISAWQLALSFTGSFLGAGFVSGQELWQFFACFGPVGLLGFLATCAIFFYLNYAALRLVQTTGDGEMSRMLTLGDHPRLQAAVSALQCLFLFGIAVIMIAGAASLLHQLLGLPTALGGALFTIVVAAVALAGLQGLVAAFSLLVPATTACAVILAGVTLVQGGFRFAPAVGSVSPLLPNWIVASLTYAAYNLFCGISILVPFASMIPSEKTLRRGLTGGSVILTVLAWSIIAGLAVQPSAGSAELPMAVLAGQLHPALEAGYGLLMGMGMLAAALSSVVAAMNQLELRFEKLQRRHNPVMLAMLAVAFLLSMLGFGNLIGVVYPMFGYATIPLLACIVINWRRVKKAL